MNELETWENEGGFVSDYSPKQDDPPSRVFRMYAQFLRDWDEVRKAGLLDAAPSEFDIYQAGRYGIGDR